MNKSKNSPEAQEDMISAAPKKATRPPTKKGAGQASRISYKDRDKLSTDGLDPNFHYHIFNDDNEKYAGRVASAKKIGYTIVNDGKSLGDESGIEPSAVGSATKKHVGFGTHGVLMRIPKQHYEEDKAAKQAEIDRTEEGMVDETLLNASDVTGEGFSSKSTDGTGFSIQPQQIILTA